ncbi:hypothetical protein EBT25_03655, partial [bacterium]|nr:hypothetical protein [bacterium]
DEPNDRDSARSAALQEPGDFLYFLFLFVMTVIILMLVLTAIIIFVNIALFPVYMPGIGTF